MTFQRDVSPQFAALMEENVDRWGDKEISQGLLQEWTRSTRFTVLGVLSEKTQPPAEDDFSADVKGDILDFRTTSQQGKRWNSSDRKDQREILWRIRKKRPKLVIGYGKCILFCTVLYHEQIRRGAWFFHDLSGDASQLSLQCMISLECRHDVFHALGDARDRRDGERVSFVTNSPHIARRVEGSKRREDLDSEICEGSSATCCRRGPHICHDAHGEWNTGQALRHDSPNTEEAQSKE